MFKVTKKINILNNNFNKYIFNRSFTTKDKKNIQKCEYCKGTGVYTCKTCNGIGRTYYGEKEYRCDVCKFVGFVCCEFCQGSGVSHKIF